MISVKFRIKKKEIYNLIELLNIVGLYILLLLPCMFGSSTTNYYCIIIAICFLCLTLFMKTLISNGQRDFSVNIILPVFLSAFQNIYLGFLSPFLSSVQIQVLTIVNFLYALMLLLVFFVCRDNIIQTSKFTKQIYSITVVLVIYCLFIFVIFGGNVISAFASLRNILAPFLFFIIGLLGSKKCKLDNMKALILVITLLVLCFGFLDLAIGNELWKSLNITDLWIKKGLNVNIHGVPRNYYSSEIINGERIRRMVSSFADPVNLGTFLCASFLLTWYFKKTILCIGVLVAIALIVSKGAFLGILIFIVVKSYFKDSSKFFAAITASSVILVGVAFLNFAKLTSANSVFRHITGFLAASREIIYHPFGRGLGNIGVLARLFSTTSDSEITESGLGMIIGQTGLIGLFIYIIFFILIFRRICLVDNKRLKILLMSLLLSISSNIIFNEVALSPNSCALYFIVLGLYLGNLQNRKLED